MPHHDAPETSDSVRIFKQNPESDATTPFITRHMGIESLRIARQAVHEAKAVYLHVPRDRTGKSTLSVDFHRRLLTDILLSFRDGDKCSRLSLYLAFKGYTYTFYTTGIDAAIFQEMREAMTMKKGLFNLPEEIFCYPMRPWEIRRLQRPDVSEHERHMLDELRPILNVPECPENVWKANDLLPVALEDEEDTPVSQAEDSFYFRLIECPLRCETLCYPATSTIPGAGLGLFVKPHKSTIARGTHLCLYSERASTNLELSQTKSSRMYVVETRSGIFDAEIATGNNLGRYANQRGVVEELRRIKELSNKTRPNMTSDDWLRSEQHLDSLANAEYKVVSKQLVLVAKEDLASSAVPTEIFTNYGSLRTYWIHAEKENPGCFGGEVSKIIRFLLQSDDCNWSPQQRSDWSSA